MLVGITGKKFNGKDTVADYIVKEYGGNKVSLAYPVKEICRKYLGYSFDELHNPERKEEEITHFPYVTPRKAMQFVGGVFRELSPDVWIEYLKRNLDRKALNIIADVRYPNEANICDIVIRVIRPEIVANDTDKSENSLDNYNATYVLINDGTVEELYKKIDEIMSKIHIERKPCLLAYILTALGF